MQPNMVKAYNLDTKEEIVLTIKDMHKNKEFSTFLENAKNNNHTVQIQQFLFLNNEFIASYEPQTIKY